MHTRRNERDKLKRKLEAGLSIHMPAPRRIGKTWTINRLASDLTKDGWSAIEVDVQGMRKPEEFARELCKRIEAQFSAKDLFKTHFAERVSNVLGGKWGDKPLDALGKIDPVDFLDSLIETLNEISEKSAILIDEIAYFFLKCAEDDPKQAGDFAYKLRALVSRYKNVRWLLTGSIGLNNIARQYGLEGAFVDFETFVLNPFSPDEARSFLRDEAVQQQLNHTFDASDRDFDEMFCELGWLAPFYLKLVANEVRPSTIQENSNRPIAIEEDFEAAFVKLLEPNRQSEFAVWREHIKKNFPVSDSEVAMNLLHSISANIEGETLNTLVTVAAQVQRGTTKRKVRDILAMLLNDGLIMMKSHRYMFRSGLIRRYWNEYEAE